jgi:hypothetical protein
MLTRCVRGGGQENKKGQIFYFIELLQFLPFLIFPETWHSHICSLQIQHYLFLNKRGLHGPPTMLPHKQLPVSHWLIDAQLLCHWMPGGGVAWRDLMASKKKLHM